MKISIAEAFNAALNIEITGEKVFRSISENVTDFNAKELFIQLADEEKIHVAEINTIIESIKGIKEEAAQYSVSEDVDTYIQAVLHSNIFHNIDSDKIVAGINNENDAIKLAIEVEKNAILFYSGLLDAYSDEKIKNFLLKLVLEERKHLQFLVKKQQELVKN